MRPVVVGMAAVLASFCVMYAVCASVHAGPSPAILAAALCVGLVQRSQAPSVRRIAARILALPAIALGAGIVGLAFLRAPVIGAVLFSGGLALSVALRQFGERAAAAGRTLALPFIAMLVVPVQIDPRTGVLVTALLVVLAGAVAALCAAAAAYLSPMQEAQAPKKARRIDPGWTSVPTRMALQMLAALALAFAVGMTFFPSHWFWIVLSAFIVCSGAIGRGDALHKALLRVFGAIGGTFAAALVTMVQVHNPPANAALVFAALFAGMRLRRINYAYWAACATLIFALMQGAHGEDALALFAARVLCVFIGALCGVAATWFVFPIRTEQVVRRRVADALLAMRDVLGGGHADLKHHAEQLQRVAAPVRMHRAVFGAKDERAHPAFWIDRAHALLGYMREPAFDRASAAAELRAIGALIKSSGESKTVR